MPRFASSLSDLERRGVQPGVQKTVVLYRRRFLVMKKTCFVQNPVLILACFLFSLLSYKNLEAERNTC